MKYGDHVLLFYGTMEYAAIMTITIDNYLQLSNAKYSQHLIVFVAKCTHQMTMFLMSFPQLPKNPNCVNLTNQMTMHFVKTCHSLVAHNEK